MIARVWHGWTRPATADAYERLLREHIIPGIADRRIAGYAGIHVLRRDAGGEVEFKTIMWFASLDAVRRFVGEDVDRAYVPQEARALLHRFDERSTHYDVRDVLNY